MKPLKTSTPREIPGASVVSGVAHGQNGHGGQYPFAFGSQQPVPSHAFVSAGAAVFAVAPSQQVGGHSGQQPGGHVGSRQQSAGVATTAASVAAVVRMPLAQPTPTASKHATATNSLVRMNPSSVGRYLVGNDVHGGRDTLPTAGRLLTQPDALEQVEGWWAG